MADDIAKLLKYLDIPKIVVLGHSLGGKVAIALALSRVSTSRGALDGRSIA